MQGLWFDTAARVLNSNAGYTFNVRSFTVELWVKFTNTPIGNTQNLVRSGGAYSLYFDSNPTPRLQQMMGGNIQTLLVTANSNEWYFVLGSIKKVS